MNTTSRPKSHPCTRAQVSPSRQLGSRSDCGHTWSTGKASTTNAQTVAGLTLNTGANAVVLTANATANPLALTVGAITATTGIALVKHAVSQIIGWEECSEIVLMGVLVALLKAAVSVALLWVLFSRVDVARLWSVARHASALWLIAALWTVMQGLPAAGWATLVFAATLKRVLGEYEALLAHERAFLAWRDIDRKSVV